MASNGKGQWTINGQSNSKQRRHSKEDALSERQYELLFETTHKLDDKYAFEARFCLVCAAKLGMRAGEIAHVSSDWLNWSAKTIDIPEFDNCTKGADGEACGYCRGRARDYVETHNISIDDAKERITAEFDTELTNEQLTEMAEQRVAEQSVTFEEALEKRWNPKTINSSRSIPFDFDTRTELCIERFDEQYDVFPKSKATVNRRINRLVDESPVETRVYPHCLRATSASFHAARDVSAYSLMSILGWDNLETARSYIAANDETAAKEIRSKHR
jgi:hypothetical protein